MHEAQNRECAMRIRANRICTNCGSPLTNIFHEYCSDCYNEIQKSNIEEGKNIIRKLGEFEGKKIITYTGVNGIELFEGNFDMKGYKVTSTKFYNLCKTIGKMSKGSGGIIMRQFTNDIDTESGIPIKKLYGWFVKNCQIIRLSKEEVEKSQNTNSNTGERLEPEKSVIYC